MTEVCQSGTGAIAKVPIVCGDRAIRIVGAGGAEVYCEWRCAARRVGGSDGHRWLIRSPDHHRLCDGAGGASAIGDLQGHVDGLGHAELKTKELRCPDCLAVQCPDPVQDAAIVCGTGPVEAAKE